MPKQSRCNFATPRAYRPPSCGRSWRLLLGTKELALWPLWLSVAVVAAARPAASDWLLQRGRRRLNASKRGKRDPASCHDLHPRAMENRDYICKYWAKGRLADNGNKGSGPAPCATQASVSMGFSRSLKRLHKNHNAGDVTKGLNADTRPHFGVRETGRNRAAPEDKWDDV